MDYPLCDRTVTVYRKRGDGTVERRVAYGCWYQWEDRLSEDAEGQTFVRKFLLIQPGDEPLCAGDRIYDGVGPEEVDWESFLPVSVPGLSQAEYAMPLFFEEELCHWEAGRK